MNSAAATLNPQTDIHSSRVLILDFGAQYTQLIARRVREQGVFCEILPWDVTNDEVRKWQPRGIILSGGPESVTDKEPPQLPETYTGTSSAGAGLYDNRGRFFYVGATFRY